MSLAYSLWLISHVVVILSLSKRIRDLSIILSGAIGAIAIAVKENTFDKITYVAYFDNPDDFISYTFEPGFRAIAEIVLKSTEISGQFKYELLITVSTLVYLIGVALCANGKVTFRKLLIGFAINLCSIYFLSASQIFFRQYIAYCLIPLSIFLYNKNKLVGFLLAALAASVHISAIFGFFLFLFRPEKYSSSLAKLFSIGILSGLIVGFGYKASALNEILTDGSEGGSISGYLKLFVISIMYVLTEGNKKYKAELQKNSVINAVHNIRTILFGAIIAFTVSSLDGLASRVILIYFFFETTKLIATWPMIGNQIRLYAILLLSGVATNAKDILS